MTAAYWEQWDKDDLDSWQGKEIAPIHENEEDIDPEQILKAERMVKYPVEDEMYDLGMSWRDFF